MLEHFNLTQLYQLHPQKVRSLIREGRIRQPTAGISGGFAQGNLVVLPKKYAYDFLLYTQRNPKPCPVLEVSDVGSREFKLTAKGSDIARDIPRYRIFKDGQLQGEVDDVVDYWRDDLVSFLLGCSFSFESALIEAGIKMRHIDDGSNVSMYVTNIQTKPAGIFSGPLVVSMRPIPYQQVVKAVTITSQHPEVHGAPVHIGDPALIGIQDISKPDFGDAVRILPGEVPVFWACGVTPQAAVIRSKPSFVITHAPGHMFITDIKNNELDSL
ncbi:putative hydro-lyase [Ignatzschineria larvae DSM 13226]|uniref:Putative hydro-lyase WMO13_08760 n=1 Tax=Ignatzschineria larvae DSM 13226 TaxID=1111732 RepID=A0ABZ3BY45_9GAMM|nr:putative hydro-lyase [Ignatzschineria larvae]